MKKLYFYLIMLLGFSFMHDMQAAARKAPMTAHERAAVPAPEVRRAEPEQCPICFTDIPSELMIRPACGHAARLACLTKWYCTIGSFRIPESGASVLLFDTSPNEQCIVCKVKFDETTLKKLRDQSRIEYTSARDYENKVLLPEITDLLQEQRTSQSPGDFRRLLISLLRTYMDPRLGANPRIIGDTERVVDEQLAKRDQVAAIQALARRIYMTYKGHPDFPAKLRDFLRVLDTRAGR